MTKAELVMHGDSERVAVWFDEWLDEHRSLVPKAVCLHEQVYAVLQGKTPVAKCLDAHRIAMQRVVDDLVMAWAKRDYAPVTAAYPLVPIASYMVDGSWRVAHETAEPRNIGQMTSLFGLLPGLGLLLDGAAPL